MINIKRFQKDRTGRPIVPTDSWFRIAQSATKKIGDSPPAPQYEFDSRIYGHDAVRMALEKLFHGKCAYCESKLPESGWPVEHYRPKGRIAEEPTHPGYYWLAYCWYNLYPACTSCNERRRDKPIWAETSRGATAGKGDQFPLVNPRTRAWKRSNDLRKEKPLLLDPCKDKPERHLTYDVMGAIHGLSVRGETTIRICFLHRRRLQRRRADRITAICGIIKVIKRLESKGRKREAKLFRTRIIEKQFLADCCQFLAVSRAVVGNPTLFGI